MKRNRFVIVCASIIIFLAFGTMTSRAQAASTDVTIKITEPELYIERVIAPQFEKYHYSNDDKTVSPISNLTINVIDQREVKGGWKLNYRIGLFEKASGLALGEFHFLKGKLYANNKEVEATQYQAADFDSQAAKTSGQTIVTVPNGNASAYQYVVEKKDIFLDVPARSEMGKYYSKEVVTLESTPDSE